MLKHKVIEFIKNSKISELIKHNHPVIKLTILYKYKNNKSKKYFKI